MELPKTKPRVLIFVPKGTFLTVSDIIEEKYPVEVESTGSGYFVNNSEHLEFTELRIIGENDVLSQIDFNALYDQIKTAIKADFDWDLKSHGVRFL